MDLTTVDMNTAIKVFLDSRNYLVSGNVITTNNKGIAIANGDGNTISENMIFDNAVIGIDLCDDGATANGIADVDVEANNLQKSPIISQASLVGNDLTVTYRVDSKAQHSSYVLSTA